MAESTMAKCTSASRSGSALVQRLEPLPVAQLAHRHGGFEFTDGLAQRQSESMQEYALWR